MMSFLSRFVSPVILNFVVYTLQQMLSIDTADTLWPSTLKFAFRVLEHEEDCLCILTLGACFPQHRAGQKCRSIIKTEKSWWVYTSASLTVSGTILTCVPVSQTAHSRTEPAQQPLMTFLPFFPVSLLHSFRAPGGVTSVNKLFAYKSRFRA